MKIAILAGGFGTRLSEHTELMPKPMITIGGKPILWHVMSIYAKFGYTDFYIALGYKSEKIKEYFLNYHSLNSNFKLNLSDGKIEIISSEKLPWKVTLIDTGLNTMTGGRIKRLKKYINNEPFMFTYGDGLSNINIKKLVEFHTSHKKLVTLTAVHPQARFGELDLGVDGSVNSFKEKPQMHSGWINGGFFVCEPGFFDYIEGDHIMLEREPLESTVKNRQLAAYIHEGFWQCMDTKRDHDNLEKLYSSGAPPWTI